MNKLRSWKKFDNAVRSMPKGDEKITEVLRIGGCLMPQFWEGSIPQEVREISRSLEEAVKKTFPQAAITGIESPEEQCPDRAGVYYSTIINISHINGRRKSLGYLEVLAGFAETPFNPKGYTALSIRLPGNFYIENTKQLLTEIWPLIRGIGFAIPTNKTKEKNPEYLGDILLTRTDQPGIVAVTGYKALKEIGLELPQKRFLTAGHTYP